MSVKYRRLAKNQIFCDTNTDIRYSNGSGVGQPSKGTGTALEVTRKWGFLKPVSRVRTLTCSPVPIMRNLRGENAELPSGTWGQCMRKELRIPRCRASGCGSNGNLNSPDVTRAYCLPAELQQGCPGGQGLCGTSAAMFEPAKWGRDLQQLTATLKLSWPFQERPGNPSGLPFVLFASSAFLCWLAPISGRCCHGTAAGAPSSHGAAQGRLWAGAPGSAARWAVPACPLPCGMGSAAPRGAAGRGSHRPGNAPRPEPPSRADRALLSRPSVFSSVRSAETLNWAATATVPKPLLFTTEKLNWFLPRQDISFQIWFVLPLFLT